MILGSSEDLDKLSQEEIFDTRQQQYDENATK